MAQFALRAEWDALRALLTWDEAKVREWSEVSREAIEKKIRIHSGPMISDHCGEKCELAEGHPLRKFKVRVVFQGNNVKDEMSYEALFQDLGSAPASMSAAKFADYLSCCAGFGGEMSDAVRAYT